MFYYYSVKLYYFYINIVYCKNGQLQMCYIYYYCIVRVVVITTEHTVFYGTVITQPNCSSVNSYIRFINIEQLNHSTPQRLSYPKQSNH